jgi:hypothetical protein
MNLHRTLEANSWRAMLSRCYRPSDSGFIRYGGRGIRVCDRWHVLSNFIADMALTTPGRNHVREAA